jgi:hypothetical protein
VGRFGKGGWASERVNFAPYAAIWSPLSPVPRLQSALPHPLFQPRSDFVAGFCHDLRYASENMGRSIVKTSELNKINRRVDPAAGLLDITEFPEKPKRIRMGA